MLAELERAVAVLVDIANSFSIIALHGRATASLAKAAGCFSARVIDADGADVERGPEPS